MKVHEIVMSKLRDEGNIVLCLESIDDWCNTHTRRCVMEVRCACPHVAAVRHNDTHIAALLR